MTTADDATNVHFGRVSDPTASAVLRGPCGDEMEFYLTIRDRVIIEARYYTEGCASTRRCARAAAEAAQGRLIEDALRVSARQVMDALEELPHEDTHCAILAVSTLYRAIADYLSMR